VALRPALAQASPEPGCINLHSLAGAWRTAERELLIRFVDDKGARLELDPVCPALAQGVELSIVAAGGWACPGKPLFVRDNNATCPVIEMRPLSQAEVAGALEVRAAQLRSVTTLDKVIVQGHH